MAKKALCVGINDYPYDGSDLNGCVNDAQAWAELLTDHYNFPASDVTLLLDSQATKANVMAGLKALLAGARSGDVLVFTNSSHGTYVADTSGDEPKYDEAMCPYDCATDLIVDDELREMFTALPKGVRLTVISDSCFSGSVTRVMGGTPDDRRPRFLDPEKRGAPRLANPMKAQDKRKEKFPESGMATASTIGRRPNSRPTACARSSCREAIGPVYRRPGASPSGPLPACPRPHGPPGKPDGPWQDP